MMKDARKVLGLLLLGSLLSAAACSHGTAAPNQATLTPAKQMEQDPTFWPMWGSGTRRPGAAFKL